MMIVQDCVLQTWSTVRHLSAQCMLIFFIFFKILFIYIQRQGKGGRKRERERHL